MTPLYWMMDHHDPDWLAQFDDVTGAELCDWFDAKAREIGLKESEEAA